MLLDQYRVNSCAITVALCNCVAKAAALHVTSSAEMSVFCFIPVLYQQCTDKVTSIDRKMTLVHHVLNSCGISVALCNCIAKAAALIVTYMSQAQQSCPLFIL